MRCHYQVDDKRKPSLAELIPDWPTLMAVEEVTPDEPPAALSHPESYSKLPDTHAHKSTKPNVFTRGAPFCLTDANQSSNDTKRATPGGAGLGPCRH